MNYIQKLLNGEKVEWKTLGEVLDYQQPTPFLVQSKEYSDNYKTPVLTAGQSFILGYTDEENGIYQANKEKPVIIFDDFTTSFHWVDFPFKVKSSAMKMLTPMNNEEVCFKFVFYAMQCIKYKPEDHARQWISKYSKIQIPIPPLAVQQKIAEILDRFAELEAELEAELHLREKQYNYYRNHLLTPNEQDLLNGKKVEWKSLGEVILHLRTGLNPRKNFVLNTNDANNYYITVRELGGTKIKVTDKTDKINDEALKIINNRSKLKIGDILFSGTGTIGSTAIVSEEPKNWNIKEGVYAITPNSEIINSMFLLRLFQSESFVKELEKKAMGGIVKSISMADLQKIQIPIPSIEEQERIVKILDKFDTLVNSISEGLPKEIALRRKQYEYYREQLLSF